MLVIVVAAYFASFSKITSRFSACSTSLVNIVLGGFFFDCWRRKRQSRNASMRARRTTATAPTAMPAFAPVDRPPPFADWDIGSTARVLEEVAKMLVEVGLKGRLLAFGEGERVVPKKSDIVAELSVPMEVIVDGIMITAADTLVEAAGDVAIGPDTDESAEDGQLTPSTIHKFVSTRRQTY